MSTDETTLIARHLAALGAPRADVVLGIGDDAALLRAAPGCELVMTTDTLVEGVHFLPGADPRSLGHRALAVNLSDLAAMGADPCWALLSLTLPSPDDAWLAGFAAGAAALLRAHDVALVGGNLTRGPLNIGVTLTGQAPSGMALRRTGAAPGDCVCVSGTPGDAAAGRGPGCASDALRRRFEFPEPRVSLGRALRGLASACIDVSDGLARDLGRLAQASGVGVQLRADALPVSAALQAAMGGDSLRHALYGGEDYELLFTVPADRLGALHAAAQRCGTRVTAIGDVRRETGVWLQRNGALEPLAGGGWDHFS